MCRRINDLHRRLTEIGVAKMVSWSKVQVNVAMRLTHCGASAYRKGRPGGRGPGLVGFSTAESPDSGPPKGGNRSVAVPSSLPLEQARFSSKLSNSGGERLRAPRRESPLGASKVGFSLGQQGWPDGQGNSAVSGATRRIHHSGGEQMKGCEAWLSRVAFPRMKPGSSGAAGP